MSCNIAHLSGLAYRNACVIEMINVFMLKNNEAMSSCRRGVIVNDDIFARSRRDDFGIATSESESPSLNGLRRAMAKALNGVAMRRAS